MCECSRPAMARQPIGTCPTVVPCLYGKVRVFGSNTILPSNTQCWVFMHASGLPTYRACSDSHSKGATCKTWHTHTWFSSNNINKRLYPQLWTYLLISFLQGIYIAYILQCNNWELIGFSGKSHGSLFSVSRMLKLKYNLSQDIYYELIKFTTYLWVSYCGAVFFIF